MSPAVAILIKLGIRLVVFTGVFWVAAKKNEKVVFEKKWATPLVAFVFAVLNTALYWALKPVLNVATLGAVGVRDAARHQRRPALRDREDLREEEVVPHRRRVRELWMAMFLTLAHGALWVAHRLHPGARLSDARRYSATSRSLRSSSRASSQ